MTMGIMGSNPAPPPTNDDHPWVVLSFAVPAIICFIGFLICRILELCCKELPYESEDNDGQTSDHQRSLPSSPSHIIIIVQEDESPRPRPPPKMKNLPTKIETRVFDYNENDPRLSRGAVGECLICLDELKHGDKCRVLPKCDHIFHVRCIDHWLMIHPTCPMCRIQFRLQNTLGIQLN
ncbi:Zinc finger, RING-type [Dillenia turbinata]|uniref:Zinc finger, RING-type n=1 Tax=Dillenia turbinata TaxID=194707 RepID=A0AAN8ZFI3_9MAGN